MKLKQMKVNYTNDYYIVHMSYGISDDSTNTFYFCVQQCPFASTGQVVKDKDITITFDFPTQSTESHMDTYARTYI